MRAELVMNDRVRSNRNRQRIRIINRRCEKRKAERGRGARFS